MIGIHQEDKRNLGSHLRSYLDAGFIVLKRDDEDEDVLEYYDHVDFERDREIFKKISFDEGSYIVVPVTSGGLLQKIAHPAVKKGENETLNTKQLTVKGLKEGWNEVRQYYSGTIFDVFRKIDIAMNGILSAAELNQFGMILDDEKFKKIRQIDFKSKKFKDISCTTDGLTRFGFMQFLFINYKPEEIATMLSKLGYDEKLTSLRSRVFVITFQSDEPIRVKVNDILQGNMYKTAMNIFLNHLVDEESVKIDESKIDSVRIVKYYDKRAKSYLFAAINNSDSR